LRDLHARVRAAGAGIMNSSKDDHERTIAFAEIAFGQIKALRQLASPPHFEI
jgi:diguanylate cyclase